MNDLNLPWDDEWLVSVGFVGELYRTPVEDSPTSRYFSLVWCDPPLVTLLDFGGEYGWSLRGGTKIPPPKTRRDVVDLCRLLGVELKN